MLGFSLGKNAYWTLVSPLEVDSLSLPPGSSSALDLPLLVTLKSGEDHRLCWISNPNPATEELYDLSQDTKLL